MNIHGDVERCRRGVVHAGFTVDSHRRVPFLRLNGEITRLETQIASYISNKRANTEADTRETAKVKQMAEGSFDYPVESAC